MVAAPGVPDWNYGSEISSFLSGTSAPCGVFFALATIFGILFSFFKENKLWFRTFFIAFIISSLFAVILVLSVPYYVWQLMTSGSSPNAPAPILPPAPPVKHPDPAPTDPASKKSSALSVVTPPMKLKAPITIAVRAPNYADSQYLNEVNAADDLYSSLKSENFKVVDDVNQSIDESKINLFIDVNSVHFSPDTSNESCPNGIAPWDENATIEISVSWNGGDGSSFPISISGNDLRCSDDDAKASALIDAIRNGDNQIRGAIEQAIKDNDSPD